MMRALLCVFVLVSACAAPVGLSNNKLPRESTPRCQSLCAEIGLPLDSVVIMADNVGCVCRAAQPMSATQPGASASAGGMAAVMMAQEAAEKRRASATQRRNNAHRPKY